jgi:Tfp pilus assembly protein PilF
MDKLRVQESLVLDNVTILPTLNQIHDKQPEKYGRIVSDYFETARPKTTMKDDLYSALQYLRSGRKQEARRNLLNFIQTNPKNPHAWFLLSFAVKNKEHKRDCLQRVLEIDPNHVKAKK